MEEELHELLQNSQLTSRQKESFQEMLTATFDLIQAPLNRDSAPGSTSLIDSSSISLYSKMQELVASLAALIMSEEDVTRMEEGFTRIDETANISSEDSTEYSDGDSEMRSLQPQLHRSDHQEYRRRSLMSQQTATTSRSSTPGMNRMRNIPVNDLQHRSSRESLRSPLFSSPKLPSFPAGNTHYRDYERKPSRFADNIGGSPSVTGNKRHGLQVINTPLPRSFSSNTRGAESPQSSAMSHGGRSFSQRSSRPTSMYVSPTMQRSYNPNHSYNETMEEYSHVQPYGEHVGSAYGSRRNSVQFSWSGSQAGTPGTGNRKRYSMRF